MTCSQPHLNRKIVGLASKIGDILKIKVLSDRSVELPKITHLPKTTENHLENHIYRGIIPS